MHAPTLIPAAMMLACSTLSYAQSQKPGLWEHSTTMQSRGGEMAQQLAKMKKQLAALPPDQRKAMEQMMGMSVTTDGQTMTMKHCVTPEEAAKALIPSHDEKCKYTITQRTASSLKTKFVCTDKGRSFGEGEFRFQGDSAYSGKFSVTTMVSGKPERMQMSQSGKWLSAQCGNVKPMLPAR